MTTDGRPDVSKAEVEAALAEYGLWATSSDSRASLGHRYSVVRSTRDGAYDCISTHSTCGESEVSMRKEAMRASLQAAARVRAGEAEPVAPPAPSSAIVVLREALETIAEGRDAGRHDGLPEEYPVHDADTMFAVARNTLHAEASGERAWRPIASAPKDGTHVLAVTKCIFDEEDEDGRVIKRDAIEFNVCVAYFCFGGFVQYPFGGGIPRNLFFTHWMPLPPPPESTT